MEAERSKGGSLKPSERVSLMKLVFGMAKAKYNYDPAASRGPAPKNISNALALAGLELDEDTVRKWLRKASELLSE
jgi:hypothetical protein